MLELPNCELAKYNETSYIVRLEANGGNHSPRLDLLRVPVPLLASRFVRLYAACANSLAYAYRAPRARDEYVHILLKTKRSVNYRIRATTAYKL